MQGPSDLFRWNGIHIFQNAHEFGFFMDLKNAPQLRKWSLVLINVLEFIKCSWIKKLCEFEKCSQVGIEKKKKHK